MLTYLGHSRSKHCLHFGLFYIAVSVTSKKSRQMSRKVAQNDSTRKMKDFDTFT